MSEISENQKLCFWYSRYISLNRTNNKVFHSQKSFLSSWFITFSRGNEAKQFESYWWKYLNAVNGSELLIKKKNCKTNLIRILVRIKIFLLRKCLCTEAAELHCVADLPICITWWSNMAVAVSLAIKCAVLTACCCKWACITALLDVRANPVKLSIVLDSWMHWVSEYAFVVLECAILVNPVRVNKAEWWELLTCLHFCEWLKVDLWC